MTYVEQMLGDQGKPIAASARRFCDKDPGGHAHSGQSADGKSERLRKYMSILLRRPG